MRETLLNRTFIASALGLVAALGSSCGDDGEAGAPHRSKSRDANADSLVDARQADQLTSNDGPPDAAIESGNEDVVNDSSRDSTLEQDSADSADTATDTADSAADIADSAEDANDGRMNDASEGEPTIENVWPPVNERGAAVLITGRNLVGVTHAEIGGIEAPVAVLDSDASSAGKVMVTVPQDAPLASNLSLRLRTDSGKWTSPRTFAVVAAEGNLNTVVIPYVPAIPTPAPLYPPIEDTWLNECVPDQYYRIDVRADDRTVFLLTVDGEQPGYYDATTRLVRLIWPGEYKAYVGVFSETGIAGAGRLVLFPATEPGRQLVLFVCRGTGSGGDFACHDSATVGGLPFPVCSPDGGV